ncbi:MAG: hypothetical protein K2W95_05670 [Candidatus Obscuribacterales bacterium]|nr:hypothetical protein [Candidatus Obscuribacterales bacterium]
MSSLGALRFLLVSVVPLTIIGALTARIFGALLNLHGTPLYDDLAIGTLVGACAGLVDFRMKLHAR